MKRALILLTALTLACQGSPPESNAQVIPGPRPTPPQIQDVDASRRTAITEATARVAPAVVTVQTETIERVEPFLTLEGLRLIYALNREPGGGSRGD